MARNISGGEIGGSLDRIPVFRRAVLTEKSVATSLAGVAAAVGIATGARWLVDHGELGIPFVTFYPAVLLATVVLGWRYGAIAAVLSAILANRFLRDEPILFYVSAEDAWVVFLFALSSAIIIWSGETLRRMVREQETAREREALLKAELVHRVRNLFAVVQSIGTQTFRHSSPEEFVDKFHGRLAALERGTSLFNIAPDRPCDLRALIEGAVAAFRHDNFSFDGPAVKIEAEAIVPLSLALHELCTNAVKHGALGADGGVVDIAWRADDTTDEVILDWQERGGPKIGRPQHKGLGTALLREQRGLKEVSLDYPESGLTCTIVVDRADADRSGQIASRPD